MNGHQKDLFSNVLTVDGTYFAQALNPESNTSWPPELSSGDRVPASDSLQDAQSPDLTRASNNPEIYSSVQYIYSLPSNSFPTQSIYNSYRPLQDPNFTDNWQPLNPITTPQTEEPQGKAEPYVRRLQPQKPFVPNAIASRRPGSLVMPAQTSNDLPAQEPSTCLSRSTLSPSAPAYPASASSVGSPNTNNKIKMEAARMEDGLLHCAHADCVNELRVFSRRCEYT